MIQSHTEMLFRHRHQLRRWAARVLMLWLFGVGAGVANACLGPGPGAWGGSSQAQAGLFGAGHHDATAVGLVQGQDAGLADSHGGSAGPEYSVAMSNCAAHCDQAGLSIPLLKPALDDLQGHALRFAAVALVHPGTVDLPAQPSDRRRAGAWAPPIHIAFLRLAL